MILNELYSDMWNYVENQLSHGPLRDTMLVFRSEVAQLEAELEILKDLDVSGLKIIATELAKTGPPYKWSSMWRDCGIRQSTIGKQLLRLCDKLGGEG